MKPIEIMKRPAAYASGYENIPTEAQARAKEVLNRSDQDLKRRREAAEYVAGPLLPHRLTLHPSGRTGRRT